MCICVRVGVGVCICVRILSLLIPRFRFFISLCVYMCTGGCVCVYLCETFVIADPEIQGFYKSMCVYVYE